MNIQKMDTWAVLGVEAYPNYWGIDNTVYKMPVQGFVVVARCSDWGGLGTIQRA